MQGKGLRRRNTACPAAADRLAAIVARFVNTLTGGMASDRLRDGLARAGLG